MTLAESGDKDSTYIISSFFSDFSDTFSDTCYDVGELETG
jgi:hypothetical protein